MLSCMPSNSKCEWKKLAPLVDEYNKIHKTNFVLEECLDVKERQKPRPEVRLKDMLSEHHMVIEQKSIIWPENKGPKHKVFHQVADEVLDTLNQQFRGRPYVIEFMRDVALKNENRDALIKEIIDISKAHITAINAGKRKGSNKIIPWIIYEDKEGIYEHDGIAFVERITSSIGISIYEDKIAYQGICRLTKKTLERAVIKFEEYQEDIKLVLLSYYCDGMIGAEDVKGIINEIEVPESIDQLWVEDEEYINEEESIPKFICVYEKKI